MANYNINKFLIYSISVVCLTYSINCAYAADLSVSSDSTWGVSGDLSSAANNDNADIIADITMTIDNSATVGNITNSINVGNLTIKSGTTAALNSTNLNSLDINGDFTLINENNTPSTGLSVTVNNNVNIDGNLVLINSENTVGTEALTLTINGDLTINGTTDITALSSSASGKTTLIVNGIATFNDVVNLSTSNSSTSGYSYLYINGTDEYGNINLLWNDNAPARLYVGNNGITTTVHGSINSASQSLDGQIFSYNAIFDGDIYASFLNVYGDTIINGDLYLLYNINGNSSGKLTINSENSRIESITTKLNSITLGADVDIIYNAYLPTTLNLNTYDFTVEGNINSSPSTITSTINSGTNYGSLILNGSTAYTLNANTIVDITTSYTPTSTTSYTIINGSSAVTISTLNDGNLIIDGVGSDENGQVVTNYITWYQDTTNTEDLVIVAKVTRIDFNNKNSEILNNTINDIETIGSGNSLLSNVYSNKSSISSVENLEEYLETITPEIDGSSQLSIIDASTKVQDITNQRILSLLTLSNSSSGIPAGSIFKNKNLWTSAYYNHAHQDNVGTIDGYSSDTNGIIIGYDNESLISGITLGAAFSYGLTSADSEDANKTDTKINSAGITAYGIYEISDNLYLNGQINYSYNNIKTTRKDCGASGLVCYGDTHSNQYSGKILAGYKHNLPNNITLIPQTYISAYKLFTNGYSENGTGTNLDVDSNHITTFNVGINIEAQKRVPTKTGDFIPKINVGVEKDLVGDKIEVTSSFVGDSLNNTFTVSGASPERVKYNIGAGFEYNSDEQWSLSSQYQSVIKDNYRSNLVILKYNYKF